MCEVKHESSVKSLNFSKLFKNKVSPQLVNLNRSSYPIHILLRLFKKQIWRKFFNKLGRPQIDWDLLTDRFIEPIIWVVDNFADSLGTVRKASIRNQTVEKLILLSFFSVDICFSCLASPCFHCWSCILDWTTILLEHQCRTYYRPCGCWSLDFIKCGLPLLHGTCNTTRQSPKCNTHTHNIIG